MYLVEDVRLASPTQLAALDRRKAFLKALHVRAAVRSSTIMPTAVALDEISKPEPMVERIIVRKYQQGFASDIVKATCVVCGEKYHVEPRDILGRVRSAKIVRARHSAVYILRHITLWSLPEIGRRLGGRDHTTIIHALRKFERLQSDVEAMAVLEQLKAKTLEQLKAGGVDLTVSPFSEQYVSKQQEVGEGTNLVAASTSLENGSSVAHKVTESTEV